MDRFNIRCNALVTSQEHLTASGEQMPLHKLNEAMCQKAFFYRFTLRLCFLCSLVINQRRVIFS